MICSFLCQDQDPEHCVQRFQQRAGAYEHHCEGLHCFDRCDPLQGVVREALLLQDRSEGRGDEGRSEQAGGREQVEPLQKLQDSLQEQKEVIDQLASGKILARISSRPGQCGRADGYILEDEELAFYHKKINQKKK